jgi:hypothetical protein
MGGQPARPRHHPDQAGSPVGPVTPAGWRGPNESAPTTRRRRRRMVLIVAGLAVQLLLIAGAVALWPDADERQDTGLRPEPTPAADPARVVQPKPVGRAQLDELPQATTFGTMPKAPRDQASGSAPSGLLVHPTRTAAVYTKPGGQAIAALPTTQLGGDTWLPVIAQRPGWVQVLLPSRPNRATGWLHIDRRLKLARTPYRLEVDRKEFTLALYRDGEHVTTWTVGIGKPEAITPAGRTFVLANIRETKATFSPIVLPLGSHSDTHKAYGGGPGTVGIHGWPSSTVFGTATSDGCIRVPDAALEVISTKVPLGTPVLVR